MGSDKTIQIPDNSYPKTSYESKTFAVSFILYILTIFILFTGYSQRIVYISLSITIGISVLPQLQKSIAWIQEAFNHNTKEVIKSPLPLIQAISYISSFVACVVCFWSSVLYIKNSIVAITLLLIFLNYITARLIKYAIWIQS